MAFCVMVDGTTKTIPAEKAIKIWRILNNELEPENQAQEDFCMNVKRIYLNRETAPASYLKRFPNGQDKPVEGWWQK